MEFGEVLEQIESELDRHPGVSDWERSVGDEDDDWTVKYEWKGSMLNNILTVQYLGARFEVRARAYRNTGSHSWVDWNQYIGRVPFRLDKVVTAVVEAGVDELVSVDASELTSCSRMRQTTTMMNWKDGEEPWREDGFEVSVEELLERKENNS